MILQAFYHKGRRAFLPMTAEDLQRKLKKHHGEVTDLAALAVRQGLIKTNGRTKAGDMPVIYELSEQGRKVVMGMMVEGQN